MLDIYIYIYIYVCVCVCVWIYIYIYFFFFFEREFKIMKSVPDDESLSSNQDTKSVF